MINFCFLGHPVCSVLHSHNKLIEGASEGLTSLGKMKLADSEEAEWSSGDHIRSKLEFEYWL